METTKLTIKDLKNQIKVLSQEQIVLKNQRKTIKLKGERKMEPWKAWYQHQSNRTELRDLYLTYGILRGKNPKEIDKSHFYNSESKDYFNNQAVDRISKLIEKYNGEIIRSGS